MRLPLLIILIFLFIRPVAQAQDVRAEQIDRDLDILLISDLNGSYGSERYSEEVHDVVAKIDVIQPDMILCAGDMVAGQLQSLTLEQLRAMWAAFQKTVFDPIRKKEIPFGFTLGNHDASPNYHNDRQAASAFWESQKTSTHLTFVDDRYYPYYFSYIKNNVFFISWDASSAHIPEDVKVWMQQQLARPIAKDARARILLGHLPLYAIVESKNKAGEVLDAADKTLQFIQENGVDMYVSGHQHAYFPGQKKQVHLLHSGALGGGPRSLLGSGVAPLKAYALIRIPKDSGLDYRHIQGIQADQHLPIELESLPDSIRGFNGVVKRADIAEN